MIAVTGATGNIGRALVHRLLAAGAPVRALTRDPQRAALPEGADVVRVPQTDPADPADPTGPASVFDGVTRVFLYAQAAHLLPAARAAGVRHVVLLSSSIIHEGADDPTHPIHIMHARVEQQLRDSGLDFTFLRPGAFATNALQYAPQIRAGHTDIRGVYADGLTAPIHEDDIAAVAERALLDTGHEGAVHRLTGPEAISNADQITAIGQATGRDLRFAEIPPREAGAELFPHVPPHMLDRLLRTFADTVGTPPEITPTVEKITGTPARTFTQWATDHTADFRN
ncbi:NmrA family NAD(P)-binding protein [Streptomyces sp. NPDC049915]|uniref:NmrA family NAD(P)-binding protein n=1 Tax=Streptomyces sp. NPDC049915 TaxID=3155510 RepID=UPI00342D0659